MCVYYSNCIAIMSNIYSRTDTSTCTYYLMANYIRSCIVCVAVVYNHPSGVLYYFALNLHL